MVVSLVIAQLTLPRKFGFLPLIIAGCHIGNVEILPELTTARVLILIGLIKAMREGPPLWSSKSRLDVAMAFFSVIAICSTLGHEANQWVRSPLMERLGLVLNVLGSYLYGRAYLPDIDSFRRYASLLPLVLIPLAIGMTFEQRTRQNPYHLLGAGGQRATVREGKVRAQGPFRHPILAGTAGASALAFAYLLWYTGRRRRALLATVVCMAIVLASASSGPLAAVAVSAAAVFGWKWRHRLNWALWGGVAFAIFYVLYSGRGPWYLMASIDLVGGSTGWHRAFLMDQGFKHLNEWWLCGTDATRHWMPTGVSWNPLQTDITNYYLYLGIMGGLPLMLCLVACLFIAFRALGRRMLQLRMVESPDEMVLWCAGTSIATHALSFVSISYFDQMYILFYVLLGAIPGLVTGALLGPRGITPQAPTMEPVPVKPLRYYS